MKKTKTVLASFLLATTTITAQNLEWARSFGGTGYDSGESITIDASGNIYTTGYFKATVDFNPGTGTANLTSAGESDIFIQKMDASGNFLWVKSIGGTLGDYSSSICLDGAGNVYVTGYYEGTVDFDPGTGTAYHTSVGDYDIFVLKIDASGSFLWAKSIGGNNRDFGYSISTDDFGNLYSTGYYRETVDFDPGVGTFNLTSAGNNDFYVLKMDASGNFLWAKSIGAASSETGESISIDASGNVYITGSFFGIVDFNSGAQTAYLQSVGNYDIFVQKINASGDLLWARSFGGTSFDGGNSINIDAFGNVYTNGYFSGTVDFDPGAGTTNLTSAGGTDVFVQKMDASGNFLWAKSIGGATDENASSISIDASGNIFLIGSFQGTAYFNPDLFGSANLTSVGEFDIFILNMDASGNFQWVKSFGSSNPDNGLSINLDALGNIYTTGNFSGTVDFDCDISGTVNLTSTGGYDVFIQKLSQRTEVNGYVFEDVNGNGLYENGEIPVPIQTISYGNGNDVAITNENGFFRAFPEAGNQLFNFQLLPYYINTTPVSQNANVQIAVIDTLYFGIQALSLINDLKVDIHPYTFPRPGFTRNYQLSYQNTGTTTLNDVKLKFLKTNQDVIVYASGSYTTSNDTLIWNLGTLQPFDVGSFTITNTLSSSTTLGTITNTQAWIIPVLDESTPQNNEVALNESVIGSYDPNDKAVIPESSLPSVNEPLEYVIRFQNTGNYQADFVIIKDTLDTNLDISKLQMIAASHPYQLQIENRIAIWTFAGINLPDSTTDEPGSHGFLKFRIERLPGLGLGTQILNKAAIYFDYNSPIITNTCVFIIETILGIDELGNNVKISAFPNPSSGVVHVKLDQAVTNVEFVLTDLQGKELLKQHFEKLSDTDIELPKPSGIYFLIVKTAVGQSTIKLKKE